MSLPVRLSTVHLWWYHGTSTVRGRHHSRCESCHMEGDLHPKTGEIRGVHWVKGSQNDLVSGPAARRDSGSHGKIRERRTQTGWRRVSCALWVLKCDC
jgi:hypothetical protein